VTSIIARLVVFRGGVQVAELACSEVQLRRGLVIGADQSCDLRLAEGPVSGRHAELRLRIDQIQLVHLSATNPTVVGARKLAQGESLTLTGATEIIIAPFRIAFTLGSGSTPGVIAPSAPTQRNIAPPAPAATANAVDRAINWPIGEERPGRYLAELPAIFQEPPLAREAAAAERSDDPDQGQFLGQYLKIFEAVWEPFEQRQDHLARYFDPHTCPAAMLELLSVWAGVERIAGLTADERRRLVAGAGTFMSLYGTRKGLQLAIRACTGLNAAIHDVPGQPYLFRLVLPPGSERVRSLVEQVVQELKPAYMGYTLE
jgi:phage tail-like protein